MLGAALALPDRTLRLVQLLHCIVELQSVIGLTSLITLCLDCLRVESAPLACFACVVTTAAGRSAFLLGIKTVHIAEILFVICMPERRQALLGVSNTLLQIMQ